MTTEDIFNFILTITIWHVFKIFILIALLIYMVYAFVVIRQVKIMTITFETGLEVPLRLISWLHLGLVIFIFLIALFVL